jgi:hypothetical protein
MNEADVYVPPEAFKPSCPPSPPVSLAPKVKVFSLAPKELVPIAAVPVVIEVLPDTIKPFLTTNSFAILYSVFHCPNRVLLYCYKYYKVILVVYSHR